MTDYVKDIAAYAERTPKLNEIATDVGYPDQLLWNQYTMPPHHTGESYIREIQKTLRKNSRYAAHHRPFSLQSTKGYTPQHKGFMNKHINLAKLMPADELLAIDKNHPEIQQLYLREKYNLKGQKFQPYSVIGIQSRGTRGANNHKLMRMPHPSDHAMIQRQRALQGFSGGVAMGPINLEKNDFMYTNTTSSQIMDYLQQTGQGNIDDYNVKPPKISYQRMIMSGAMMQFPTISTCHTCASCDNDGSKPGPKNTNKQAQKMLQKANRRVRLASMAMYDKERIDRIGSNGSHFVNKFKAAVNALGTPSYDDVARAAFFSHGMQMYHVRDLKRGRQKQGVEVLRTPLVAPTAPYVSLYNNQDILQHHESAGNQLYDAKFLKSSFNPSHHQHHISRQAALHAHALRHSPIASMYGQYRATIPLFRGDDQLIKGNGYAA